MQEMGLRLHVWDKLANAPIDYDIPFGASNLDWPGRIERFKSHNPTFILDYVSSESIREAVEGVRCWMTDDPEVIIELAKLIGWENWGGFRFDVDEVAGRWRAKPFRYRFVLELAEMVTQEVRRPRSRNH